VNIKKLVELIANPEFHLVGFHSHLVRYIIGRLNPRLYVFSFGFDLCR